jgi:hypothetical protein
MEVLLEQEIGGKKIPMTGQVGTSAGIRQQEP